MESQQSTFTLDGPRLRIELDQRQGGKVIAVFDRTLGRNLLLDQHGAGGRPLENGRVYSVSGWDEAIPTLEPHGDVPTMGYAWHTPPECRLTPDGLESDWTMPGWTLERRITTDQTGWQAAYRIVNSASQPQPLIWVAHALFPIEGLDELLVPGGAIRPGPDCDLSEVKRRFHTAGTRRSTSTFEEAEMSWKFFVPGDGEVSLRYRDAELAVATDAPWFGIWLNLGRFAVRCVGVEPTNEPTDYLQNVASTVAARGEQRFQWSVRIRT